jgi:hypothetical protein
VNGLLAYVEQYPWATAAILFGWAVILSNALKAAIARRARTHVSSAKLAADNAVLTRELQLTHERLLEQRQQTAYWQKRAERYIDRSGVTTDPVMEERQPTGFDSALGALTGAGMTEFDSTKPTN